ncbi:hypothetical protein GCM10028807_32630 [Spirosoma daeguense]
MKTIAEFRYTNEHLEKFMENVIEQNPIGSKSLMNAMEAEVTKEANELIGREQIENPEVQVFPDWDKNITIVRVVEI